MNIAIVGFMGTGKTTVAKKLMEKLGLKYISTDSLIEEKVGKKIPEIFSQDGEEYFRKLEQEVIAELSLKDNLVIDCGGGVVINPTNVNNLKKNGIIFCLWAKPEVILERVKDNNYRPLLNVADRLKKIKELLMQRKQFYYCADHHIDTSNISIDDIIKRIISLYNKAKNIT